MKAKRIRKWRWSYWDVDPVKWRWSYWDVDPVEWSELITGKQAVLDEAINQVQEELLAKGFWKTPALWSAKLLDSGIIRVCRKTVNDPQHLGPWNKGTSGVSKGPTKKKGDNR